MNAEIGQMDATSLMIAMGMNKGGGGGGGGDPVANQKDMLENLFDNIGTGLASTGTIITGVPHKGELLSTGIFKQLEPPEGVHEKLVLNWGTTFSTPGGFLYRMFSALIKNGEINSQTEGLEALESLAAADYGEGGDSGGGGGGDSGGNYGESSLTDFAGAPMAGADIESLYVEYGGHRYEAASMGESALGELTPSAGADIGSVGRGDIEIG